MKKQFFLISTLFLFISQLTSLAYTNKNIKVDQFGYLPNAEKIAVISQSVTGRFSPETYVPGTVFEVRKTSDSTTVFSGQAVAWNTGKTDDQSGDKVWHFDFTTVTGEGAYFIIDVDNNVTSYSFQISKQVYDTVMQAALRVFYYQRRSTSKPAEYAGADWADGEAFLNPKQDAECMLYGSKDVTTKRDLRGGWFDAGDYNQYVTFTVNALTDLLLAYQQNPQVWTDNTNIPESGNGVPDILDETKWELDWILRMQTADGGVLCVKGEPANLSGASTPPSVYKKEQRYGPATTAASYTAATVLSLAAIVYEEAKQTDYALSLKNAAIAAYNWAVANPSVKFTNSGKLCAGENQRDDSGVKKLKIMASIYLFQLTSDAAYKPTIDANVDGWGWISMYETEVNDAWLMYYTNSNATASVKTKIKSKYTSGVATNSDYFSSYTSKADAYRAFMRIENYTWGSNKTKSAVANSILNLNGFKIGTDSANYYKAAQGYLNYMHGINPNNLCYLTNMKKFGAENSTTQIYHTWFGHGSKWDTNPPSGYIPGGPNSSYNVDACCPTGCGGAGNNALCNNDMAKDAIGQPTQKAYADINDSWPVDSWAITEPGIYYQAAYVRLVSSFVSTKANLQIPENVLKAPVITSVENILKLETRLYPNPTNGMVTITVPTILLNSIKVFTMVGSEVSPSVSVNNNNILLDLSQQPNGQYLVQVGNRSDIQYFKVTKLN